MCGWASGHLRWLCWAAGSARPPGRELLPVTLAIFWHERSCGNATPTRLTLLPALPLPQADNKINELNAQKHYGDDTATAAAMRTAQDAFLQKVELAQLVATSSARSSDDWAWVARVDKQVPGLATLIEELKQEHPIIQSRSKAVHTWWQKLNKVYGQSKQASKLAAEAKNFRCGYRGCVGGLGVGGWVGLLWLPQSGRGSACGGRGRFAPQQLWCESLYARLHALLSSQHSCTLAACR